MSSIRHCLPTLFASTAVAFPFFQTRIPNGDQVMRNDERWPGVGHMSAAGGDARNDFGKDFLAAGKVWTKELCEKDSDGDNQTNGFELGDPECVWAVGKRPARSDEISHPGVADSVSNAPDILPEVPKCIARGQIVYTGCSFSRFTFEREADRDLYCGFGGTSKFIPAEGDANPDDEDLSCDLEPMQTVYTGCDGLTFQSALNRRESCGPRVWTSRDTSFFIPHRLLSESRLSSALLAKLGFSKEEEHASKVPGACLWKVMQCSACSEECCNNQCIEDSACKVCKQQKCSPLLVSCKEDSHHDRSLP